MFRRLENVLPLDYILKKSVVITRDDQIPFDQNLIDFNKLHRKNCMIQS